jgi:hypothetical protein
MVHEKAVKVPAGSFPAGPEMPPLTIYASELSPLTAASGVFWTS